MSNYLKYHIFDAKCELIASFVEEDLAEMFMGGYNEGLEEAYEEEYGPGTYILEADENRLSFFHQLVPVDKKQVRKKYPNLKL
jgi:hypothetical protein